MKIKLYYLKVLCFEFDVTQVSMAKLCFNNYHNMAIVANLWFCAQRVERTEKWWPLPDLNWGPTDYESGALTN